MPVFPTERGGFEMEQRKKGKERGSSSFLQAVFLGTGGIRRAVLMLTCHPVCFASSRQLQLQVGAQRHTKHGRRRGISTCVRPKPSVTVSRDARCFLLSCSTHETFLVTRLRSSGHMVPQDSLRKGQHGHKI